MSQVVKDFMDQWLPQNVHLNRYLYDDLLDREVHSLALQCVIDAQAAGVAQQELEEEFGDLSSFMRATLQRLADESAGTTDEASHPA